MDLSEKALREVFYQSENSELFTISVFVCRTACKNQWKSVFTVQRDRQKIQYIRFPVLASGFLPDSNFDDYRYCICFLDYSSFRSYILWVDMSRSEERRVGRGWRFRW